MLPQPIDKYPELPAIYLEPVDEYSELLAICPGLIDEAPELAAIYPEPIDDSINRIPSLPKSPEYLLHPSLVTATKQIQVIEEVVQVIQFFSFGISIFNGPFFPI